MASSAYMAGRTRYARPQAMLWSNNSGTLQDGKYIPDGVEGQDFIILSDGNRQPIDISQQRIETRQRMINGTMRSYFTADKINLSTSWQRLPSRSYSAKISYNEEGKFGPITRLAILTTGNNVITVNGGNGISANMKVYGQGIPPETKVLFVNSNAITLSNAVTEDAIDSDVVFTADEYTVDGGAGGADLRAWYEDHPGPFWVFLSYDKTGGSLNMYNDIRLMFFGSFDYTVEQRGGTNHDFWNVNVSLEEA